MNSHVVIGIDIGMETHQYQISDAEQVFSKGKIPNSREGGNKLLSKINEAAKGREIIVGMEATNNYHLCLQHFLEKRGLNVVAINPLKTSAYKNIDDYGNKSDPIDANGICQFMLDGKHKSIKKPVQRYHLLKELCLCWLKLQGDMTGAVLRLRSRLIIINPEFEQYFSNSSCPSGLYMMEKYLLPEKIEQLDVEKLQQELDQIAGGLGKKDTAKRIVHLAKESFGIRENIDGYIRYVQYHLDEVKFLRQQVLDIKREIRQGARKEEVQKELKYVNSIKGVGEEVAAGLLAEIGTFDNFGKISSIVRFAGLTVLQNQSGKKGGRGIMSKQGSPQLRCYLYQAAMGAKLHSATFAAVYANRNLQSKDLSLMDRKIAKAKALANIARRILETVFICVKKKRLFNDQIAFESLKLDTFVRETIAVQFKQQLAQAAVQ